MNEQVAGEPPEVETLREMTEDCAPEGALWRVLGSAIDGTTPAEHERYEQEMADRHAALRYALRVIEGVREKSARLDQRASSQYLLNSGFADRLGNEMEKLADELAALLRPAATEGENP
jgi:hypothetical protein